jgi:hypothetical protein
LSSEPEITRKNEIFPDTENSCSRENGGKLGGVRWMNFSGGKVGLYTLISVVSRPDIRDFNQLLVYKTYYLKILKTE